MKQLYEKNETCIFLFQDDDFLSAGNLGKAWALDFIDELERNNLADKFLWKISCRTDEIDNGIFKRMKQAGLFYVYLGIESGNPIGLKILNKQLTVEQNINGVETLKHSGLMIDSGFMLTDPSSTFETVRENISFLRQICGDGSFPAVFCKMIPYAETDIERALLQQGRLKGSILAPDYDFFDHRLNHFTEFLHETFREWMFARTGFRAKIQWQRFELAVLEKFYPAAKGIEEYGNALKIITAASNDLFFKIAEEAIAIFEQGRREDDNCLKELVKFQSNELERIKARLFSEIVTFNMRQKTFAQ